ncbi:MAG: branched-chain amino acid ABC transporter substrate-binding protein [Coriobacteriia bacterium]|jgi:branched-chain amino acid transport system substrate-binding protein|nr:branched-chain amino acid ABC transporter substrate-binding protein [Coriobacteriia bacterium]
MKHKGMERFLALALIAVLVFSLAGLAGCAKSTDEEGNGATGETVKIKVGVQTALTGPLPDYGAAAKNGVELALEDFGKFEMDGKTYQVELVVLDDKAEPSEAAVVAQTMVDEGVVGVIGSLTTGATLSAIPIYAENRIPQISGSVTGPQANAEGVDTFYRTCWSDAIQGEALGVWAMEMGAKKVVLMDDNGAYAVGLADVAENTLKEKGAQTLRQNCQSGDKDLSAQVANVKEFAPDALIFTGYHPEGALMRKQMVEAGLGDVIFMGGDGLKSAEFVEEAGGKENAEGCFSTFGGFPEDQQPGFAEFASKYKEKFGGDVGPYAQNNYDAFGVLMAAIQKAGSTDTEKIISALQTIEYEGVTGTFSFAPKAEGSVARGDIVVAGLTPNNVPRYTVKDGEWVAVSK